MQVLIVVPAGLPQRIEQTDEMLAANRPRTSDAAGSKPTAGFVVVDNSADEKSMFAYQRVKQVLNAWEQRILQDRLSQRSFPQRWPAPSIRRRSTSPALEAAFGKHLEQGAADLAGIVMAVTGDFYPAVDVAAGEKERGTMETLLICPAQRRRRSSSANS